MILPVCDFFITIGPVLINVAFFTLLERKILGLSQLRKGPNKVSLGGLLQPMSDAVKLFMKEITVPYKAYMYLFFLAPGLSLFIVLCIWSLSPDKFNLLSYSYSISLFLIFLAMNIFPLFFAGWCSNSKYALMGATRGISQSVSYEISLALVILVFLCLSHSLQMAEVFTSQKMVNYFFVSMPLVYLWVVCCVAETNRSPFDFAEGESELVSGFNIEYGATGFALIFMAEYAMILFLSYISGLMLFPFWSGGIKNICFMILLGGYWVWLRCTYPRYRYDKLMMLAWKSFLPAVLSCGVFFMVLSA